MVDVANNQKAMSVTKKKISRKSRTPLLMDWKWVKKLNELIALSANWGAQPLKNSKTKGKPLRIKRQTDDDTNHKGNNLILCQGRHT